MKALSSNAVERQLISAIFTQIKRRQTFFESLKGTRVINCEVVIGESAVHQQFITKIGLK
ncbi:hypothetical protein FORC9_1447 [Vibrio vulnificus]|nr:hypothetical protein FORC9_1447 [Vibrio vulnificus]